MRPAVRITLFLMSLAVLVSTATPAVGSDPSGVKGRPGSADDGQMNARQILAGTLLTASLVVGGAGLAGADGGSRPAMDRGPVGCERVADRLEHLVERHDRLVDRIFALETKRDEATAAGQTRRAAGLQNAIDALTDIQARVDARIGQLQGLSDTHCNTGT